jgi:hypothetical protein
MGNRAMECQQMVGKGLNLVFIMAIFITSSQATASALTVPNTFVSGTATSASDMNANFAAVKAAVDDNNTRISSIAGATSSFKGFSSGTTQGNGGLITMGNLCNSSFTGSHVCTTLEFASASYTSATGLTGNAWIQASLIGTLDQVSLISGNSGLNCNSWTVGTAGGYTGLAVSSVGGFTRPSCNNALAVACCN